MIIIITIIITIIIILICIFMRGQNLPPTLNNMLIGVKTSNLHEGSKCATPYGHYVDWGNHINFISMRDENSPPPMNNMLVRVIASTLSSWGIKIRHRLWALCWFGVITSTISPWGIKIRHPYKQYVDWGNNINFIFIATWSQTRSNVRVAANMFIQYSDGISVFHAQIDSIDYISCSKLVYVSLAHCTKI